ncbi:MAG: ABC-F family ATP-binding cassette domain-containing protein [Mycoplasmoidaceae bacterium]
MSILKVKHLSQNFGPKIIFDDANFTLYKNDHLGIVGPNGRGKSTFMKIIAKKEEPSEGVVEWNNKLYVGYMDQYTDLGKNITLRNYLRKAFDHMYQLETEMIELYTKMENASDVEVDEYMKRAGVIQDQLDHSGFYEIDSKINQVCEGLGVSHLGWEKDVSELSGGQRTKVLLVKLLLESPDILLLDEPTNYLDEEHIRWLQGYLQNYPNAFILISHDLEFLNAVTNVICHIENYQIHRYVGDYQNFIKVYELNQEKMEAAFERQQKQISKMQTFIAKNKARASTAAMAQSRQKALDKIDKIELNKKPIEPKFVFKEARDPSKLIFDVKNLVIGYDQNNPLSLPINFTLEKNQKIAIIGTNGLGKTTLLKSLIALMNPLAGSIEMGNYIELGYFEQESIHTDESCLENVWRAFDEKERTHQIVRTALARCGLTRDHIEAPLNLLSGGEQAKAKLCKLINNPTNLLVLDEPTNHLDKLAKKELKRALQAYNGSIILVSHEPEFYKDIVTDVLDVEKWSVKNKK